jgi:carboxyl-terminal processing protease
VATRFAQEAIAASTQLRRAGPDAVLAAGFDEVFVRLDPYSRYVPAAEAADARRDRVGQSDLGLRIGPARRGRIAVTQVRAGGPAARAGVLVGDHIVSIDGVPITAADAALAALLLEGPPETEAVLRLRREGRGVTVRIGRERQALTGILAERHGDGVLVLRLPRFVAGSAAEVEAALRGSRVPGVILDLRGNRGGLLSEALAVADLFLETHRIAAAEGRHPDATRVWDAGGPDLLSGRPVVVLVDGRTASAAEVLAGALADSGRGAVVGSVTRGKGLIQVVIPLPGGGELQVSWSRLRAPGGAPIEGVGIVPALCTARGEAEARDHLAALLRGEAPMREALAARAAARPEAAARVARELCPPSESRMWDDAAALALLQSGAAYRAALAR